MHRVFRGLRVHRALGFGVEGAGGPKSFEVWRWILNEFGFCRLVQTVQGLTKD